MSEYIIRVVSLLLLTLLFDKTKSSIDSCVLSSSISNTNQSGYFGYPLKYYESYDQKSSNLKSNFIFPCEAKVFTPSELTKYDNKPETWINLFCSNICPLNESHLNIFQGETFNDHAINNDSFCSIYKTLKEKSSEGQKKQINIIILGGSVAEGYRAAGCYRLYGNLRHAQRKCSYGAQLYRWFSREASKAGNAVVNFNPVTLGGWTSQVMSELLFKELGNVGITKLTPNDIVIIDHSVNDDAKLSGNVAFMSVLEQSLETIIRKLLSISEETGPVMILHNMASRLKYEGHVSREQNETVIKNALKPRPEADIKYVYKKLANYYRIPFWSYQDLLWGEHVDELGLSQRVGAYGELHPPWHVHLLVSDLFASAITKEFSKCNSNPRIQNLRVGTNVLPRSTKVYLPSRLFNTSISSRMFCDLSSQTDKSNNLYLDRDASVVYKYFQKHTPKNHHMIPVYDNSKHNHSFKYYVDLNSYENSLLASNGSSLISDSNSWVLKKERRNKIGWVSEFTTAPSPLFIKKSEVNERTFPASNINSLVNVNLTFHLKSFHKAGDAVASNSNNIWNHEIGIQIYILKTYLNAGVASVYLCNHKIGTIDALWTDYKTYKVSSPELQSFTVPWFYDQTQHPCHPSQKNPHTISIVHEKSDTNIEARQTSQKLKVMSVTVCKSKPNAALGYR